MGAEKQDVTVLPEAMEAILAFVDQIAPSGCTAAWLTGSSVRGMPDRQRLVPRHSDFDMLNPNITATLAGVSDRRGLRYCERLPVSV
jgi:hypothetical protein